MTGEVPEPSALPLAFKTVPYLAYSIPLLIYTLMVMEEG
jgi:hypothetical protein